MKLRCENVGLIKDAEIEIDAITLIAGDNSTGKSTFSKSLFALFNLFSDVESKEEKFIKSILTDILYYGEFKVKEENFENDSSISSRFPLKENNFQDLSMVKTIVNELYPLRKEKKNEENKVVEILKKYADDNFKIEEKLKDRLFTFIWCSQRFVSASLGDKITFNKIFSGQIKNIFSDDKDSKLSINFSDDENDKVEIFFENDEINEIHGLTNFSNNIVYIDNPFILDRMNEEIKPSNDFYEAGKTKILLTQLKKEKTIDFFRDEKLKNIIPQMNAACDGEIIKDSGRYTFRFKNKGYLELKELSTGIKTFAIIKTLLLNGSLAQNDFLILDEPEVHLHPGWQNKFAEIIVLLQKEFNLHILINTHSTYFVTAIDNFSKIHGIKSKCHFYFLHKNKDDIWSEVQDVSNDEDLSKIYASFYNAMTEMDRKLWEHEEKQQNG